MRKILSIMFVLAVLILLAPYVLDPVIVRKLRCHLGRTRSCYNQGIIEERNGEVTAAIKYYGLACKEGSFQSCANLADVEFSAGNYSEATKYFQLTCEKGYLWSCRECKRKLCRGKDTLETLL